MVCHSDEDLILSLFSNSSDVTTVTCAMTSSDLVGHSFVFEIVTLIFFLWKCWFVGGLFVVS